MFVLAFMQNFSHVSYVGDRLGPGECFRMMISCESENAGNGYQIIILL